MTCDKAMIIKLFDGSSDRLIVPVYQRKYDWKEEQCKQLYTDLKKLLSSGRNEHFFGSVVVVSDPSGAKGHYLIVDGQQRFTTITILLLALYRHATKETIPLDTKDIWEKYLTGESARGGRETKIRLIEQDQVALNALFFAPEEEWPNDNNLVDTYRYFYQQIETGTLTGDQLFDAISKLAVVNISLAQDDNPQLVFESLNSKGLPLDEGDKIRNYILMGLSSQLQMTYHKQYWSKIEACVQPELSGFFRDYLTVKQQTTPNIRAVYATFKEYHEEQNLGTEAFLQELYEYAKRYKVLLSENDTTDLGFCICRLNRLETTVTRPFLLEVLRLCDEGILNTADVYEIFKTVECYIFRRIICDLPTSSLNKIFRLLHREILRMDKREDNYLEKFKYALRNKRDGSRYPDDAEFAHWLSARNIYQMNAKNKKYLLERLEDGGTKETKGAWTHLNNGTYTIEHIMPQHLTPGWISSLGDNYQTIHETWLHRLANLTLTAYNSEYSNHEFMEKRNAPKGFKESGLRINGWIANQSQWTLPELEERDRCLQEKVCELWPMVTSSYWPPVKPQDIVSLEDDITLTGRNIERFRFRTMEQTVDSWAEMYQQVLLALHSIDSSILTNLAHSDDQEQSLSIHFSTNSAAFTSCRKLNETLYVWTGTDTQYKVNTLKRLFNLFKVDESDLIFYLKEENLSQSPAFASAQRKAYWGYALPIIQASLQGESYTNVNPTEGNYIDGFIGLSNAHLCCVANYEEARVELYIGGGTKEENKALFDYLHTHKTKIEAEAGRRYNWLKLEEGKASKINLVMSPINLMDESTWASIATFHGEETSRLYATTKSWLENYQP